MMIRNVALVVALGCLLCLPAAAQARLASDLPAGSFKLRGRSKLLDVRGDSPKLISRTLVRSGTICADAKQKRLAFVQIHVEYPRGLKFQLCVYDLEKRETKVVHETGKMQINQWCWSGDQILGVGYTRAGLAVTAWGMDGKPSFEKRGLAVAELHYEKRILIYSPDGKSFNSLDVAKLSTTALTSADSALEPAGWLRRTNPLYVLYKISPKPPNDLKARMAGKRMLIGIVTLDPVKGTLTPVMTLKPEVSLLMDGTEADPIELAKDGKVRVFGVKADQVSAVDATAVSLIGPEEARKLPPQGPAWDLSQVPRLTHPEKAPTKIGDEADAYIRTLKEEDLSKWVFGLDTKPEAVRDEVARRLHDRALGGSATRLEQFAMRRYLADPGDIPDTLLDIFVWQRINQGRSGFSSLWFVGPRTIPSIIKLRKDEKSAVVPMIPYVVLEMFGNPAFMNVPAKRAELKKYVESLSARASKADKGWYAGLLVSYFGEASQLATVKAELSSAVAIDQSFAFNSLLKAVGPELGWDLEQVLMAALRSKDMMGRYCKKLSEWLDINAAKLEWDDGAGRFRIKKE